MSASHPSENRCKSRFNLYLDEVEAGEEIIIRERNKAVARLVPLVAEDEYERELQELAARSKIRLGGGCIDDEFWKLPAPKVRGKTAQQIEEGDED